MLAIVAAVALALQPGGVVRVVRPGDELHCVQDALGAEVRQTVGRNYWGLSDDNGDGSAEIVRLLRAAVEDCAARHGWRNAERQNAVRYAIAVNGLATARAWLAERNVPIERWEAVYAGTPVAERLAEDSSVMRDRLLAEVRSFPATAGNSDYEGRAAIFHVMRRGLELSQRDWGGPPTLN